MFLKSDSQEEPQAFGEGQRIDKGQKHLMVTSQNRLRKVTHGLCQKASLIK